MAGSWESLRSIDGKHPWPTSSSPPTHTYTELCFLSEVPLGTISTDFMPCDHLPLLTYKGDRQCWNVCCKMHQCLHQWNSPSGGGLCFKWGLEDYTESRGHDCSNGKWNASLNRWYTAVFCLLDESGWKQIYIFWEDASKRFAWN